MAAPRNEFQRWQELEDRVERLEDRLERLERFHDRIIWCVRALWTVLASTIAALITRYFHN